jgi:two-component system NarL family sensor kinase
METNPEVIIKTIVSTTLIIFIFNFFIIFIILIIKRKQLKSNHEIEVIKLNLEKDKLKIEIEIQEETLAKASREIHDNISLSLTLAKLHLNTFLLNENKEMSYINESINLLGKSILDLNDLSKSLDGEIIYKFGLIHSIEDEMNRLNKNKFISFNFEINGEIKDLDSGIELMVFRIIQEATNNILKHSKASSAVILLSYSDDILNIEIMDDGVGFQNSHSHNGKKKITSGIKNMRKRAQQINGNLEIQSDTNKGTNIILKIPIKN